MRRTSPDYLRKVASAVENRTVDPLVAARHIVSFTTDGGPDFLLIGSVRRRDGFEPGVPMTFLDAKTGTHQGRLRPHLPTVHGGVRPYTRAMAHAETALWSTISGPNSTLERIVAGGLGVTDKYEFGTHGWAQATPGQAPELRVHTNIRREMEVDPEQTVGYVHVVSNDGSFSEVHSPFETDGQYASPNRAGFEAITSFAVPAGALLALPNIVEINYPVE